jgi:hypothetical protein
MLALQQNIVIPKNHQLKIKIPDNIPTGENELFMVFQPIKKMAPKKRNLGTFKGKISTSKDFDAPLKDSVWLGNNE